MYIKYVVGDGGGVLWVKTMEEIRKSLHSHQETNKVADALAKRAQAYYYSKYHRMDSSVIDFNLYVCSRQSKNYLCTPRGQYLHLFLMMLLLLLLQLVLLYHLRMIPTVIQPDHAASFSCTDAY